MPIVFNPNVGNFRIDPITGEVVLLNSDGSFTTLNKNVDGTYTASRDGQHTQDSQFAQALISNGLSSLTADNRDSLLQSSLAVLSEASGDHAKIFYLQSFANDMQSWQASQMASGNRAQDAANFFNTASKTLADNRQGLSSHLGESGSAIARRAESSFARAEVANRAAAVSNSKAASIAAKYANAGAALDALFLLDALNKGDSRRPKKINMSA